MSRKKDPANALLSTNQIRVLRAFFEAPRETWTVSELAERFEVSPSAFQSPLRRFFEYGLLKQRKMGREVVYRVDQKSRLYEPLRKLLGFRVQRKGPAEKGLCVLCKERPSRLCGSCDGQTKKQSAKTLRDVVLSSERSRVMAIINDLHRKGQLEQDVYESIWTGIQDNPDIIGL